MWWWGVFKIIIFGHTTKIYKWEDCSPHTSVKYLSKKKKHTKKHIWMQTWTVMQTWKCDKGSKSHAPHPPPWTHKKVEQEMLSSLHSKPHVHTKRIWRGESVALHKSTCSQNPKSKHIKGSKEHYLLGQNTTCKFWGVIPFIKLQTET